MESEEPKVTTQHTPGPLILIEAVNQMARIAAGDVQPGHANYLNKAEMTQIAKHTIEAIEPLAYLFRDNNIDPAAAPELLAAVKWLLPKFQATMAETGRPLLSDLGLKELGDIIAPLSDTQYDAKKDDEAEKGAGNE